VLSGFESAGIWAASSYLESRFETVGSEGVETSWTRESRAWCSWVRCWRDIRACRAGGLLLGLIRRRFAGVEGYILQLYWLLSTCFLHMHVESYRAPTLSRKSQPPVNRLLDWTWRYELTLNASIQWQTNCTLRLWLCTF
jgi:hypothetical protein